MALSRTPAETADLRYRRASKADPIYQRLAVPDNRRRSRCRAYRRRRFVLELHL